MVYHGAPGRRGGRQVTLHALHKFTSQCAICGTVRQFMHWQHPSTELNVRATFWPTLLNKASAA